MITHLFWSKLLSLMLNIVSQGIFDDPIVSFVIGLVVVLVIGFALREYLSKKK
jgi:hypothetical protein